MIKYIVMIICCTVYIPLVSSPEIKPHDELMALIISHPDQQRTELFVHDTLQEMANYRANDMAARDYFDHITPEGYGPNHILENQFGYALPDHYSDAIDANNIESAAAGQTNHEAAMNALVASPSHRRHILGEVDFYRRQKAIGVGYAYSESGYKHYWVIITSE